MEAPSSAVIENRPVSQNKLLSFAQKSLVKKRFTSHIVCLKWKLFPLLAAILLLRLYPQGTPYEWRERHKKSNVCTSSYCRIQTWSPKNFCFYPWEFDWFEWHKLRILYYAMKRIKHCLVCFQFVCLNRENWRLKFSQHLILEMKATTAEKGGDLGFICCCLSNTRATTQSWKSQHCSIQNWL